MPYLFAIGFLALVITLKILFSPEFESYTDQEEICVARNGIGFITYRRAFHRDPRYVCIQKDAIIFQEKG